MLKRYCEGRVPKRSNELAGDAEKAVNETTRHLRAFELQGALQAIWLLVNRGNLYVEQTAPFKLAKDAAQATRLDEVLYNLVEISRILAVLLNPFVPSTAQRIYAQLGLGEVPAGVSATAWGGIDPGHTIGEIQPLFPRKDR